MDNALLKSVGEAVWKGMLLGFSIMSAITAVVLPASYVMNRFIYHAGPMRFVLGLMAAHPAAFLVILIGRFINWISNGTGGLAPASYSGLIPLLEYDVGGATAPEGWLASLKRLGLIFIEPVSWVYDEPQYKKAVAQLLLPEKGTKAASMMLDGKQVTVFEGGVCVPFLAAARSAGAMENPKGWRGKMKMLEESGIGQMMFGGGGGPAPNTNSVAAEAGSVANSSNAAEAGSVANSNSDEGNTNSNAGSVGAEAGSVANSNSEYSQSPNSGSLSLSPNSTGAQAGTPQEEIGPASASALTGALGAGLSRLGSSATSALGASAAAPKALGVGLSRLSSSSSSAAPSLTGALGAGLSRLSSSSSSAAPSLTGALGAGLSRLSSSAAPAGPLRTGLSLAAAAAAAAAPQAVAVAAE